MVIAVDIEAGDAALNVLAGEKTVPELGRGVGACYAASHANNGNVWHGWRLHVNKSWSREMRCDLDRGLKV